MNVEYSFFFFKQHFPKEFNIPLIKKLTSIQCICLAAKQVSMHVLSLLC